MDILDDLESLKFECGIPEDERYWLYLQGRYRGLMIKGCAHAVFFCKLFCTLRELLHQGRRTIQPRAMSFDAASVEDETLKVGIIGCGHLGRQLATVLLRLVPIPAENLHISTRRPESLVEFQKLGVRCLYDNASVASWAKVLFLCCLPSQLPNICLEIQNKLEKTCFVYSFVSAIPLPRLKFLLNHSNILRPQYHFTERFDNNWGETKEITAVLQDPVVIRGTYPYSDVGTAATQAAFQTHCVSYKLPGLPVIEYNSSFTSDFARWAARTSVYSFEYLDRPFPWFDLTTVQLKETPFSQHLSATPTLQNHLTLLYAQSFGITPTEEELSKVSTVLHPKGMRVDRYPHNVFENYTNDLSIA
ncbi:NADP-dependent oxidoreductase domain-containing protein 1 [Microtus ochrogaster]|uniref:NADP-dependent oxidoreductase domain-containing protein 1 n=1 Tax=Microtus ochrogaster TaxID=79684 RepID=A0A8J6L1H4_MICOH|nr:NADP-dependent oxidoreductase domain-containing protein 1 [Microtus ochrogaster]